MKFKIGYRANGIETGSRIIEAKDYISALEEALEYANLHIKNVDKEYCKDCGITLVGEYELEDNYCSQCQALRDKNNPDVNIG